MKTAPRKKNPRQRDPLIVAFRRLLDETDRQLAAAERVRRARVELARRLEQEGRSDA